MDQDPGRYIAQGNEFTIGFSLTILLPRPILVIINHLPDHSFAGCPPSKFNNNLSLSVFNVLYECFAYIKAATSSLMPVYSRAPPGSILGPLVNNIPIAISCSTAYPFADDTKLVKRIFSESNMVELQLDIHSFHGVRNG